MTEIMKAHPARPKYSIGEMVSYIDQHKRPQRGTVLRIEATWNSHWPQHPLILMTVEHPTYRNGQAHIAQDEIVGGDA